MPEPITERVTEVAADTLASWFPRYPGDFLDNGRWVVQFVEPDAMIIEASDDACGERRTFRIRVTVEEITA